MDDGGIHYENPFSTPREIREPIRRFRGRLTSGVTIWTATGEQGPVGLTVSSLLVAEGEPSQLVGLINDTTDLFEAVSTSRRFVVHLADDAHERWADGFAGLYPMPGGVFAHVPWEPSEHGPLIGELGNRVRCELIEVAAAGYQKLVRGEIGQIELTDLDEPLVYFRGRYRSLR